MLSSTMGGSRSPLVTDFSSHSFSADALVQAVSVRLSDPSFSFWRRRDPSKAWESPCYPDASFLRPAGVVTGRVVSSPCRIRFLFCRFFSSARVCRSVHL